MPDRFPGTWADVAKGDYVESVTGDVWKVVHEVTKDDGRYLGIQNEAGEQRIIGPDLTQRVTRLVYGDVTEEQAVETVQAILGGEVLHPAIADMLADGTLGAHLVRFHGMTLTDDWKDGDLAVIHHGEHQDNPKIHTHRED